MIPHDESNHHRKLLNWNLKLICIVVSALSANIVTATEAVDSETETHKESYNFLSALEFNPEIDVERFRETTRFVNGESEHETSSTLISSNLVFAYPIGEFNSLYLDYEISSEFGYSGHIEEFYFASAYEGFTLVAGRQDLPFGPRGSEFIEGPIVEFAELNRTAILAGYRLNSSVNLRAYAFESDTEINNDLTSIDAGLQLGFFSVKGKFATRIGILSDLAQVSEPPVSIVDRSLDSRTPAFSLDLNYFHDDWSLIFEYVTAIEDIEGASSRFNRPNSGFLELLYESSDHWMFGGRIEYSDELEESPESQWGLTTRYKVDDVLSFALEFNRGKYDSSSAEIDDKAIDTVETISVEVSLEF